MRPLLTPADVVGYLDLDADPDDLTPVVDAVTALIVGYHGDPTDEWPADLRLGAIMLAARMYRRRNSPAGVEALGELGPVYVSRNDPDLAQLLKLGRYATPKVG